MFDWLKEPVTNGEALSGIVIWERMGMAWVAGFLVAAVYVFGLGRRREEARTLPTTLVLLTIVIALVTMVIGNSVARAFGLVGALSIVRFRTVVEDTRDTAFVIFAVAVGMALGAGYAILALVGLPAILLAALLMRKVGTEDTATGPTTLTVRFALGVDPEALVSGVFGQHLSEFHLTGTCTAKQGAALELNYRVRLRSAATAVALVAELNRVEGVQGVELRG